MIYAEIILKYFHLCCFKSKFFNNCKINIIVKKGKVYMEFTCIWGKQKMNAFYHSKNSKCSIKTIYLVSWAFVRESDFLMISKSRQVPKNQTVQKNNKQLSTQLWVQKVQLEFIFYLLVSFFFVVVLCL